MINLYTWRALYRKHGQRNWEEYSFTFDEVEGSLASKYHKGSSEKFGNISAMARRIVQLRREDNYIDVELTNGFNYSQDQGKFTNADHFMKLEDNHSSVKPPLSAEQFDPLIEEVLEGLKY